MDRAIQPEAGWRVQLINDRTGHMASASTRRLALSNELRQEAIAAMSRTKKPSKLSADERALLDRIRSLNEEETEKLTFEEMITYWNIMHKIDPRSVRHAFEEAFIDRGLTNSDVLRLLERAKERAKWKQ